MSPIEVKYKRSVSGELDAAIEQAKVDKVEIESFVLNDSDFYLLMKELKDLAGEMAEIDYDKMSNSYNLNYKNIPIKKKS